MSMTLLELLPRARRRAEGFEQLLCGLPERTPPPRADPGLPPLTDDPTEPAHLPDPTGLTDPTELAELTGLAHLARTLPVPAVGPSPRFTADLRDRLLAEGSLLPSAESDARPGGAREIRLGHLRLTEIRRRDPAGLGGALRPATVVAGLLASVVALVMVSASALPGDALYGVKRRLESAQVALTWSDSARGAALLDDAGTRLDEAERLIARSGGKPADVRAELEIALVGFREAATRGGALLLRGAAAGARRNDLVRVSRFVVDVGPRVHVLSSRLPSGLATHAAHVSATINELGVELAETVAGCGSACAGAPFPALPGIPGSEGAARTGPPGGAAPGMAIPPPTTDASGTAGTEGPTATSTSSTTVGSTTEATADDGASAQPSDGVAVTTSATAVAGSPDASDGDKDKDGGACPPKAQSKKC